MRLKGGSQEYRTCYVFWDHENVGVGRDNFALFENVGEERGWNFSARHGTTGQTSGQTQPRRVLRRARNVAAEGEVEHNGATTQYIVAITPSESV